MAWHLEYVLRRVFISQGLARNTPHNHTINIPSSAATMNPAVTNLVLVLASMQGSKYIPFEDPSVLLAVRVAYIVSNLLIFGIYFYIGTQIKSKKGKSVSILLSSRV